MECPDCGQEVEHDESGAMFEADEAGGLKPHVHGGKGGGEQGASSSGH